MAKRSKKNSRKSLKRRRNRKPRKRDNDFAYNPLEPKNLLAGDFLEPNNSMVTAADIGVGPAQNLETVTLDVASDIDWFKLETLTSDDIRFQVNTANSTVDLQMRVLDASGTVLGSGVTSGNLETVDLSGLAPAEYFVQVWAIENGSSTLPVDYTLNISPLGSSSTRVFYINDDSQVDDIYATAIGDDANDGLTPGTPKENIQSVLDDYDVGPNDLFVIDTGTHTGTSFIQATDEGATYTGSPLGADLHTGGTTFTLEDADSNTFYRLQFSGGGTGIYAYDINGNESANNVIRANTFTGESTAIYIDDGDGEIIEDNVIDAVNGSYGIRYTQGYLTSAADITIRNNMVSGPTFGISVTEDNRSTSVATVSGNSVTLASVGILASGGSNLRVNDNVAFSNDDGITIRGSGIEVLGNEAYTNQRGIVADSGSGYFIGGTDWTNPNLIHDNVLGVVTVWGGNIQFNRIYNNGTGVHSFRQNDINHNLIYRNTVYGINVDGTDGTQLINNTIYSPSGSAIYVHTNSRNTNVKNNIFSIDSGIGLEVATDSQFGFDTDYNNFFAAPGSGATLVWWQKPFFDIFDWQAESNYDSHSLGTTVLDATLDDPQFVDQANDDYHLTNTTSTSIDAGDPTFLFNLEPGSAGAQINLGAYGNTTEAATSRVRYLEVDSPNYYIDLQDGIGQTVAWHTFDNTTGDKMLAGTVNIELHRVGFGKVGDIATNVPADQGTIGWTPNNLGVAGNTTDRYFVRIVSNLHPTVSDDSREDFSIVADADDYYVNDAVNNAEDQWTTAVGNNRNTGQTTSDPKANLLPILKSYDLGPLDTVRIDDGSYIHVRNVKISGAGGVDGNDEGATFTGPSQAGSEAIIDRGNPFFGATNIELDDADFVTLTDLTFTGAYLGLWVHNGSTNFNGERLVLSNNVTDGMVVESDAEMSVINSITAFNNGQTGIEIQTPISRLSNSVAYNNQTGIFVSVPGGSGIPTIIGSVDGSGNPSLSANLPGPTNEDRGNYVYNNTTGIDVRGNVLVYGNNVYDNSGNGILAGSSSRVERNVSHGNDRGIYLYSGASATNNRAFNNVDEGIFVASSAGSNVTGNYSYSNSTGIYASTVGLTTLANNVVYDNIEYEVEVYGQTSLFNNTLANDGSLGVFINNGSRSSTLRDNIIVSKDGTGIEVTSSSQLGYDSNFNFFFTLGTGIVGNWQGIDQPDTFTWQAATQNDGESLQRDPFFVDANVAAFSVGYNSATDYGQSDDFHLKSSFGSYHDGTETPEFSTGLTTTSGLPVPASVTLVNDTGFPAGFDRSPGIDRADLLTAIGNEVTPNGNFANIGAYGGTQYASLSPTQYVLVTSPVGGEVWPADQSFDITWRSHDANGLIDIELVQDSNPGFSFSIATGLANPGAGTYTWTVPNSITPATDYRIRITRDGSLMDDSLGNIEITPPVTVYYVNDSIYNGSLDLYTNVAGSPSNTGLSPNSPRDSVQSILNDYTLGPNSIILVDDGTYNLTTNVLIGTASGDDGGDVTGQMTIQGPVAPGAEAIFDRGNTSSGAYVFEFADADYVTISDVTATGGQYGFFFNSSYQNDYNVISNNEIRNNSSRGIYAISDDVGNSVISNYVHENGSEGIHVVDGVDWQISNNEVARQSTGIQVNGSEGRISQNRVYDNSGYGIWASNNTGVDAWVAEGNEVFSNENGIYALQATVRDNIVRDNNRRGIYVDSTSIAEGNEVYRNEDGIFTSRSQLGVFDNIVFDNSRYGIHSSSWNVTEISGNQVYSNLIGLYTTQSGTLTFDNNLLYGNETHGALLDGNHVFFTNNSVYQETGEGVQVANQTEVASLRNNIIWTLDGRSIVVDDDSQAGFDSDYNILNFATTPGLGVANWASTDFTSLADWFYEIGVDQHSLANVDPEFVDIDGADDILGFDKTAIGPDIILDDGQAGVTLSGTGWTQNTTTGNGGDYWSTTDLNASASWTFSGLAPGVTYQVYATWPSADFTTNGRYTVTEPVGSNDQVQLVNRQNLRFNASDEISANGVGWDQLGTLVASNSSMTVSLENDSTARSIVADAILLRPIAGDHGGDDDFHVQSSSPAIDAGDLQTYYLEEPDAGGGRTNIGAYGNTPEAAGSPSQIVQVLSPNGLEKLEEGATTDVDWRSWGLGIENTIALINSGGTSNVEDWLLDDYFTDRSGRSTWSVTVDTSGLANPAPQDVYQTYAFASSGVGNKLSYDLPVDDGTYQIRLHFADFRSTTGFRLMDIVANGTTMISDYDIAANAGATYTATAATITVNATGGNGILLDLVNKTSQPSYISAIEVTQTAGGVANPTVDLSYSSNSGGSYTPIVGGNNQGMDHRGRGTFAWTVATPTSGNTGLIQAAVPALVSDASDNGFLIANNGNSYYVNNSYDAANDGFTTTAGDNFASGKSPSSPMSSLAALLRAYDLDGDDTVFVDHGDYSVITNISIGGEDKGNVFNDLTIQGSASIGGATVLDRANSNVGNYVFYVDDADYVTISGLDIVGAQYGIYVDDNEDSDNLTIANNRIYDHSYGVRVDNTDHDNVTFDSNYVFDNSQYGIFLNTSGGNSTITGNEVENSGTGIWLRTLSGDVSFNRTYDNSTGMDLQGNLGGTRLAVHNNESFSNNTYGIWAAARIDAYQNDLYDNGSWGIYLRSDSQARENSVFNNENGIYMWVGAVAVDDNRVFNNRSLGIQNGNSSGLNVSINGNTVYSNSTGVVLSTRSVLENNLIYDNSNYGVQATGESYIWNNTIFQEVGDAIRIENGTNVADVRNNILWTQDGHAISVADNSQRNFRSDYNVYQFPTFEDTGIGQWQQADFTSLSDWFFEIGTDQNSIDADPEFIDFDGADDLLGYDYSTIGSANFLDDEQSGVALNGSSWTETTTAGNDGDFWLASDPTDTATWTFTGLAAGTYEVFVTYQNGDYSTAAQYTISEGSGTSQQVRWVETINTRFNVPNDNNDNGVPWKKLGDVTIGSGDMTVFLENLVTNRPLFADAVRIQLVEGDKSHDDDFHVSSTSPAIDAGSLDSYFLNEPNSGGGRVNIGRYGNTSEAAASPNQYIQILSPNGLEKFEQGQNVDIDYRAWNVGSTNTIVQMNAGGLDEGSWLYDRYRVRSAGTSTLGVAIDTAGVTNPAPELAYRNYTYAATGVGNSLAYELPLSDGTYNVRLHFADWSGTVGRRVFDILANGSTMVNSYDIAANAGATYTATAVDFNVTTSGGLGLLLELVNQTNDAAYLSAIEITQATGNNNTVRLQYSSNSGGTYSNIGGATGLPIDSSGYGSFSWTAAAPTSGNSGRIRALSQTGGLTDSSDMGFSIANNGNAFYINDSVDAADSYTSVAGDNLASGKSPSEPMSSLRALIAAYDLGPGDTVFVDNGTYMAFNNIFIGQEDSGTGLQDLTIVGPGNGEAIIERSNQNSTRYAFEILDADFVTISGLTINGADYGIYVHQAGDSRDISLLNNQFSGNDYGVRVESDGNNGLISGNFAINNDEDGFYIDSDGTNWQIVGNESGTNGSYGIYAIVEQASIDGNELYGNTTGLFVRGDTSSVSAVTASNNEVYTNTTGIYAEYATLTQNEVYNSSTGVTNRLGSVIRGNTIYTNTTGVLNSTAAGPVESNRIFNNTNDGILASSGDQRIGENQVYSNSTGIRVNGGDALIANNVVYANTNFGISGTSGNKRIVNNTVYQEVGDAIRIENNSASHGTQLYNNILWVDSGRAIFVNSTSQNNFQSDNNLFNTGAAANGAKVGFWDGTEHDFLSDWQTASMLDGLSMDDLPNFVDPNGADNTLGYSTSGVAFDAGADDNFELAAGSPAIDAADDWFATQSDFFGRTRLDDPGTSNNGRTYSEVNSGSSGFATTGTAIGINSTNTWRTYNFPGGFTFDFYGQTYSTAYVSTEGFIQFGSTSGISTNANTLDNFINYTRIAPLWDNLSTSGSGYDVYVDDTVSGQLTLRWAGTNQADGSDVNFSVTLGSAGAITFHYGTGNTNLNARVGISSGNGIAYSLASYDGASSLTNANSIEFAITNTGFADIGALEFSGSSSDVTPPVVSSTSPAFIDSSGSGPGFEQFTIEFSEAVNFIDASAPSNYVLQNAGPNGTLGDLDDEFINLVPSYVLGSQLVSLDIPSGELPTGDYRLTVLGGLTAGIHDLAGLTLDGDGNGAEGGDYVRDFTIANLPITVPVDTLNVTRGLIANGTVSDLRFSDNADLTMRRSSSSIQSVAELELMGVSHTENPTAFEFVLEASVFARSRVNQTIWLWNYQTSSYEQVDMRAASRFVDATVTIVPTGDLSRFVEAGTGNVQSRVQFRSLNNRQVFSANIDQIIWNITG